VSRIPVREAIISLDREGWVTIAPHRGAYVHGLDPDYVRDHYELYGLVYGMAARRATERSTPETAAALRAAAREVAKAQDVDAFATANVAYVNAVLAMAAAPRLTSVLRTMTGIVPGNFFAQVPGSLTRQRKGVAAITRRIEAGDGEAAAQEFLSMLRAQGDAVVTLLDSLGLFVAHPPESAAGL
jgi:DNA-binding GntR family transcriptional regulator